MNYKKFVYPILITTVVCILLVNTYLLFTDYIHIHDRGGLRPHQGRPPLLDQVNKIETWMTFDFINHSFNLPNDYLKNEFSITNKNYPRVTVTKVATTNNINSLLFLSQLKASIQKYLSISTGTRVLP